MQKSSLVLELQSEALREEVRVSALLRKVLAVARKLDVRDADAWLEHELKGYPDEAELPSYRQLHGELKTNNPFHGLQPVMFEDEGDRSEFTSAPIREPIAEIEHLLDSTNPLVIPRGSLPTRFSSLPAYLEISRAKMHPILDAVRNAVLEWALHIESKGILGEGLSFSEHERKTAQTLHNINYFFRPVSNAVVQQGSVQGDVTLDVSLSAVEAFLRAVRQRADDVPEERRDDASTALATVEAEIRSPQPLRARIVEGLKALGDVLKTGKATADLVETIVKLVGLFS